MINAKVKTEIDSPQAEMVNIIKNPKNDYYSIEEVEEENINTLFQGRKNERRFTQNGPILDRLTQVAKSKVSTENMLVFGSSERSNQDDLITLTTARRRLSLATKEEEPTRGKFKTLNIKIPERNRITSTTNLNININIQSPSHYNQIDSFVNPRTSMVNKKIYSNDNESISPKSPSKWRKVSNLFKSINSFRRYETKNIGDESEIDSEMKDYKSRLFENTIKVRKSILSDDEGTPRKSLFDSRIIRMIDQEEDRKKVKGSKEEIYKVIINGAGEGKNASVERIDKILRQDPEFYKEYLVTDTKFKYNTPLSNGKTLIYIACQEGKVEIVDYFLKNRINPFIKSKLDENEGESPLQVACRWNYINLVQLLLSKVDYQPEHIEEAQKLYGITKKLKIILKNYFKMKFKDRKRCYCC